MMRIISRQVTCSCSFAAATLMLTIGGPAFGGSCPAPGSGDECTTPLVAVDGVNGPFTTADNTAGASGDDTSCTTGDTIDEWFCYTATCTGTATASTCSAATAFDTSIAAFADCGGGEGGVELACDDDDPACGFSTTRSTISWPVTMGTAYNIRVSGWSGGSGAYELTVSCAAPMPPCDTVTLTGRESWDGLGDGDNEVITRDYSASGCMGGVTDLEWTDAEITTVGGSFGTEAEIQASASDGSSAVSLDPFVGTTTGSHGPVSGSQGAGVTLLGDMVLRLEWYETFDDAGDAVDANWTAGTLDVVPVELQSFSVE